MLSFGDVKAIKDIYGFGSSCQKHEMYKLQNGEGHMNILNVIDREDHNRKRRMLSHAFSAKNLETWEFKITDKVEKLVAQFDKRAHPPSPAWKTGTTTSQPDDDDTLVDARYWFNLFTVDAIADIALSERLGMLESGSDIVQIPGGGGPGEEEEGRAHAFIADMHEAARVKSKIVGTSEWYFILKAVVTFFSSHARSQWKCGGNVGRTVINLAAKRLRRHGERGKTIDDFLSCLIADKAGNARGLDMGELTAETNILLDAGSETTAIALTHLLYYLVKNPRCLSKLREEVSKAIAGDQIAPYSKVKSLPYLKACIDESLRLSPPLPRGLERVTPPEGATIMGEAIAGNVGVSIPAYVAHRDPDLFPEPEAFLPERWLDNENSSKMRDAFIPFSSGGRACIGRNITMIEQQILIATLVHRYDFSLPSPNWTLQNEEAFNLWPVELPVKIWKRDIEA
ncbi:benzoate 4-monooxygenase cytochrome P450 [Aspergillus ustus]|uniref:Benzoate 4-monooxygenase cytochrome P450 n=1 Tax=Aspergillus ustus TaxID=40382 RepID=A0A0C1EFZ1_ASPUT|nr:benzoate 4-monooxygenase cytochrome P450 [Aspergillus ustus]